MEMLGSSSNSVEPEVGKQRWPLMTSSLPSVDKEEISRSVDVIQKGSPLRRVKHRSLGSSAVVLLSEDRKTISYQSRGAWKCVPNKLKSVSINEILEVRTGWNTDNFHRAAAKQKFCRDVKESHCFSIIFRHRILLHKSIDLVTEKEKDRDTWVRGLSHLVALQRSQTVHFNEEQWLIQQFREADTNNSGALTFSELWELLKKLNLEISETYGKKIFERSDIRKSKFGETALDREEFLKFFRELTQREELESLMALYSSGNADFLLPKDLLEFLQQEQGATSVTLEECKQLIRKFEPDEKNREGLLFGPNGFRKFLLSKWGALMNPAHSTVFQDMTQPLPSYFIRSSHNTYLVGGQLRGEASVEGYIIAMQKGARLLELDVWDGSDGEPIVTHGHTLVVPITLRDTAQAVKNYAFCSTPYPLILTLENHLSLEQQVKMAHIFLDILGDKLYTKPFDPNQLLPSPEQLKGKILLRGNRTFRPKKRDKLATLASSLVAPGSNLGKRLPPDETDGDGNVSDEEEEDSGNHVDDMDGALQSSTGKTSKKRKTKPLAKELSDIMAMGSTNVKKGWEQATAENPYDAIVSLSEPKIPDVGLAQTYASKRLVKVYPSTMRVTDSSNVDPIQYWLSGCQMVTMNMQTAGLEMDLDGGLFLLNGINGFVLKPQPLRDGRLDLEEVGESEEKLRVEIRIVSGQYLPKPASADDDDIIDPYVTLQVFGLPSDCVKHKTSVVHNNGFNPRWDETFTLGFKAPELALLRFCVKDYDMTSSNDFIGQYTIPVQSIRTGFYHVPVLNAALGHGDIGCAHLFVHIKIKKQLLAVKGSIDWWASIEGAEDTEPPAPRSPSSISSYTTCLTD